MAHIRLRGVSLHYPIYTPRSRAINTTVLTRLGGRIASKDNVVIVQALNDLTLDLADGDRLGIIGHNGAGKSTLLRVISQIYEPQSGTVDISGKLSNFVDITLGMDPDANGWDNIKFRGVFMGLTNEEINRLAPSIAEFSELGEYLNMPMHTYSAGMFMRLAFAITTAVPPEIIVMDEMIGAGDAQFLDKAVDRIEHMLDRTRIVVVASHSNFIIRKFCNKLLWMEQGKMRAIGPVDELLASYDEAVALGAPKLST
jgi:ABC-type polysaccharide/polyol phosphate transport system ATPase subunit